jgi:hypothetical protein
MVDTFEAIFRMRGGVSAVADACGISTAAVSQWKHLGAIPEERREKAEAAVAKLLHGGPVAGQAQKKNRRAFTPASAP